MGAGAPSGIAAFGDHLPGSDCLPLCHQDLGAVAVEGYQTPAVVNGHMVAVPGLFKPDEQNLSILHRSYIRPQRNRHIHPGVPFAARAGGVLAIAKLGGDFVLPTAGQRADKPALGRNHIRILDHLGNEIMGAVAALQGHLRAHIEVPVDHPQVDLGDVGHIVGGDLPSHHSGNIGIDGGQILNGIGPGMGIGVFLTILIGFGVGAVPIFHKAVHKLPGFGPAQGKIFSPEIESIKNSLDPVGIQTVTVLHHPLHRGDGAIQRGETVPHLGDIVLVFTGHGDGQAAAIKGQFYCGVVVVGCPREHRTEDHHQQDEGGQDGGDHHSNGFPGALVGEQHHRRFDEGGIGHRRSPPFLHADVRFCLESAKQLAPAEAFYFRQIVLGFGIKLFFKFLRPVQDQVKQFPGILHCDAADDLQLLRHGGEFKHIFAEQFCPLIHCDHPLYI